MVQQDLCLPSQCHSQSLKIRGSLFSNPHIPCRLDLAPDTISEVHIDLALPGQGREHILLQSDGSCPRP